MTFMNNTTFGILAHVDAGKTTLSESLLFTAGAIRTRGRVDHGDAFLDTDEMEKKRGITIYSKTARFEYAGRTFTILDTPGHADFSPEMERTLRVLDYAVLVISAADGVTQQVRLLWKLLEHYHVPVFIFVNKCDQLEQTGDREAAQKELLTKLKAALSRNIVPFGSGQLSERNQEEVAVCDENLMEQYLEHGREVTDDDVTYLVKARRLIPLYFGAALRDEGTPDLLDGMCRYMLPYGTKAPGAEVKTDAATELPPAEQPFGALAYKIAHEEPNVRLTFMKITSGTLRVRDSVRERVPKPAESAEDAASAGDEETAPSFAEEKVSGIRIYSGGRFSAVTSAGAGDIAAVSGLSYTRAGNGLGIRQDEMTELLSPIETYSVSATDAYGRPADDFTLLSALRTVEEEEPMLHVSRDEHTREIMIGIMGTVQMEILKNILRERFGLRASFGPGRIVYRETIRRPVEGVGHFEPLRHYAEVHVLLEPSEPGSGITVQNKTPHGTLDKNWQNQILSFLREKTFRGVLTGSELTDVTITLLGGRANIKHTSAGDFRQAAYRAVRQGLMMAQNILLEPVLSFQAELPSASLGRFLQDMSDLHGQTQPAEFSGDGALVTGKIPASSFGGYAQTLQSYTGGAGRITARLLDYEPCHNAREVLDQNPYDPELDRWNPSGSVFCSHGAGTPVAWNLVRKYMHFDSGWRPADDPDAQYLTDDYYTFTPSVTEQGEDVLAADSDATEPQTSSRHARTVKAADDFAARERSFAAEENELERIFEATYGTAYRPQRLRNPENAGYYEGNTDVWKDGAGVQKDSTASPGGDPKYAAKKKETAPRQQSYLLVDGYNIIYAWNELRDLAGTDLKAGRDRLLDILSNYAGFTDENVIVVFDAYKVPGGTGSVTRFHNIDVVYTKEAETADLYIEKTAHKLARGNQVTVATSDAVEQVIIYGAGAVRLSARGLLERILSAGESEREKYLC